MGSDNIRIREIKPVLSDYISKSRELLKISAVPDEDSIHDIRVLMKKSRAVLKLAGAMNPSGLQERDLWSLKRVGQIMCHWRDKSVHRKTLRGLRKDYPALFSKVESIEIIVALMRKPELVAEPGEEMARGLREIVDLLNKTFFRIRFSEIHKIETTYLLGNLELSFEKVRNIYLECRNSTRPEKIHKFRKLSKDLLYQIYFFRPLKPTGIKHFEKRLERMTLNLGKYNDLQQLLIELNYKWHDENVLPALIELAIIIKGIQDQHLQKVWKDAYSYFAPGKDLQSILGLNEH